jgi:hypothetical protein
MKFISLLLTALPLVATSPVSGGYLGGSEITDPDVLAELQAQRADALHKYNTGEAVYLTPEESSITNMTRRLTVGSLFSALPVSR